MTRAVSGRSDGPRVFLLAGEPSGDFLGARLMAALKAETGGGVRFTGLGGGQMAAEGLESLFPIDELAVMGIVEVVPHLRRIYRRVRQTVAAAEAAQPDVLVSIDSPAFTLEISRRLKGRGIPLIHYVAPSVWAWKPWRARRMAGYLDHLLTLLPFEPPYFQKHGLATTFVGHPAVEAIAPPPGAGATFRAERGMPDDATVLTVLPGSRRGEVARLAPVFGGALRALAKSFPGLRVLVPTLRPVAEMVKDTVQGWPVPTEVLEGTAAKHLAFAAADAALAASGTVAVELAMAGVPAVVAYRVNPLTAILAARMIRVEHVSVVNLLLDRELQPELLQGRCTARNLAAAVKRLLDDPAARRAQLEGYALVAQQLGRGGAPPSHRAARRILDLIGSGGAARKTYNGRNF
jgi:lipid-A-disaccharide synthase